MGLFKKSFQKNVTRSNEFFKNYAIKINAFIRYAEGNDKVVSELQNLQSDFQYTVAAANKQAKKNEKNIDNMYEELKSIFQQPTWDEQKVLLIIKNMRMEIDEINATR